MTDALLDATALDRLSPAAADALLRPACASDDWVAAMVAARPFGSLAAVVDRSDAVLAELGWPAVLAALAAHPRIGDRPAGAGLEASWSRQEQAGAANAGADVRTALHDGNVAYEQRFGHVFLIRATGRTATEMLAALTERLGHDDATEQQVVRRELAAVVRGRLEKTLR